MGVFGGESEGELVHGGRTDWYGIGCRQSFYRRCIALSRRPVGQYRRTSGRHLSC
jgi:hypothetical protein